MNNQITRPTNPYSKMWPLYWEQNPGIPRGVGAEGAKTEVDPAEHAALLEKLAKVTEDLDKFKAKHSEAEKHRKAADDAARAAAEEAARKSGDVEALEKSWQKKFDAAMAEKDAQMVSLNAAVNDLTVGQTAMKLASELALDGSSDVLMPHIQSRLAVDMANGKPAVRVLVDGKPSALSVDDLRKEIANNKAFAPIVKGSSSNGPGSSGKPSTGTAQKTMKRSEFDKLDPAERSQFVVKEQGKVVEG